MWVMVYTKPPRGSKLFTASTCFGVLQINTIAPTTRLVTTQWWSCFGIPSTWKSPSIRGQTPVSSCAWTSAGRHPAQMPCSSPSGPCWWTGECLSCTCYSPSKKPVLTAGYPCLGAPTQETTIRQNWSLSGKPQTCCFLLTTSASAFPPSVLWTWWQSRPSRDRYDATSCARNPPNSNVSTWYHFSADVAL